MSQLLSKLNMKDYLVDFFKKNNLIIENKKLVLAISTGVDSMVLLHCFLELKKDINFDIVVCHVNHHKREQSEIEEKYIKDFCLTNNIKCYIEEMYFDLENENFQSLARKKRYEFFLRVLNNEKGDYLGLAHHGNDNMETIIMRILRGSSLVGYSGMSEISDFNGYLLIRPFLGLLKNDLINYQLENDIKYFEDESNSKSVYTRNRIRKDIIPSLLNENSDANIKFLEFSKTIKEASKVINTLRDSFIKDKVKINDEMFSFDVGDLLKESLYLQEEILFELLKRLELGKNNITEIIKIINSSKKNMNILYKENLTIIKEYENVSFYFKKFEDLVVNIKIDKIGRFYVNDTISINVIKKEANDVTNLNELWYNSINFPIIIRTRLEGDKIKLSSGYKKVKDLLIDQKIGISKRNKLLLGTTVDGEVLIVFGVKKSSILRNEQVNDIVIRVEENNGQFY